MEAQDMDVEHAKAQDAIVDMSDVDDDAQPVAAYAQIAVAPAAAIATETDAWFAADAATAAARSLRARHADATTVVLLAPRSATRLELRDVRGLDREGWITDLTLNKFHTLVYAAATAERRAAAKVMDTAFAQKLFASGSSYAHADFACFTRDAEWIARNRSAPKSEWPHWDIREQEAVLVPYNHNSNHWVLGVLFPKNRVHYLLNSMGGKRGATGHKAHVARIGEWARDEEVAAAARAGDAAAVAAARAEAPYKFLGAADCPQQPDGFDCGACVAACVAAWFDREVCTQGFVLERRPLAGGTWAEILVDLHVPAPRADSTAARTVLRRRMLASLILGRRIV